MLFSSDGHPFLKTIFQWMAVDLRYFERVDFPAGVKEKGRGFRSPFLLNGGRYKT
jgi:hypothetical protein